MEAQLEFLERTFEGYMATRDEIAELRQMIETERTESQCRTTEVLDTLRRLSLNSHQNSHFVGESSGAHQGIQNPQEQKWQKLSIPIFEGDDAFGWTNKVERYFGRTRRP